MKNELNVSMNELLSSLEVFYHKLQSYHWYVKGHAFFTVHAQLESYYDEVSEEIDEVAETLLMIGGAPVSTLKEFLELSKVSEAEGVYIKADDLLPKVRDDYALLEKLAEGVKSTAEEEGNALVSAKMDDLIESFSKAIWMISQSLMA
ncbi:DNA starvation/stationary phase protection protein [Erysipelotrichaceae bacterium Oil+RF-744-GAM-WT-6]|jgi:starvation-inducible DNA-binding protein|uniref:DNA starvation/stationary phase protection protein n=1 Tax=Stecheria intestinalis TaxID=2606630 RepID=A0A7X2NSZ0_9FIRM|nr:DNA starvation/stationary phase protection protein [Stecheria intestinalis]MCI2154428.1 DNA starvation/stationary phase protection protein [Solobacterium sp.]MDD6365451.1 DNA starvation/stationary phase protection protein [Stecheria intestinalis]MDY3234595.1 DNA starvation/stationary phase protection protein [Erysipelotrichaceae bacterium]MSS59021.1 DNA starvation/stationary phase protection protein [Stecheria intestinalis]